MAINSLGLLAVRALLAAVFLLCVFAGEWLAGSRQRFVAAAGTLVWSIVPIALAYHFSHYLTALLVNGQYALVALSDPFSLGWNLFGTAHMPVERGVAAGLRRGLGDLERAGRGDRRAGTCSPCWPRTCSPSGCIGRPAQPRSASCR